MQAWFNALPPTTQRRVRVAVAASVVAAVLGVHAWRARSDREAVAIRTKKQPSETLRRAVEAFTRSKAWAEGFVPAWVMRWGGSFEGTVSTVMHHFVRTALPESPFRVAYDREILALKDGGQVGLDWHRHASETRPGELDPPRRDAPIAIVQHGLTGSSESTYIRHAIPKLMEAGFRVVVFVARGCGGVELTTPFGFTAARTEDMREVVAHVQRSFPDAPLYGVGYSLGAGLLMLYMGEEGPRSPLRGAACVSPSFNFSIKPPHFDLWSRFRLVKGLVEWAARNKERLTHPSVDWSKVLKAETVREFDTHAVVPVYGYRDVDHYYETASAIRVAHAIVTPTLALCAADDPVCSALGVPQHDHEFGHGLAVTVTQRGGHVGFSTGVWGTESWMDRVVVDWLVSCHHASVHQTTS